jgi:hypothetical protein
VPMGAPAPALRAPRAARSGTATEDAERRREDAELRSASVAAGAAPRAVPAASRAMRFATRSLDEARAIARRVGTGELHAGGDDEDL